MIRILILLLISFSAMPSALAFKSSQFKGWYEILSRKDLAADTQYMMVDVDTLAVIWAKYAEGPLPPDLEQYKDEPSIIAGFTDRDLLFFLLERSALVGEQYLALQTANGDKFELKRRADGRFDLGVRDKGRISLYLLSSPKQQPESD